jgi:cytoskeleton protein RodZ
MTDQGDSSGPVGEPALAAPATAGAMLRAARESAGLHIGALAVALKVPVSKLESLEADRFSDLPDAVFVRALAASVCKVLKLEPGPVLALLPGAPASVLVPDRQRSHGAFRPSGERWQLPLVNRISTPVAVTVGALLLGTFALLFWPRTAVQPADKPSVPATPRAPASDATAAQTLAPRPAAPASAQTPGALAPPVVAIAPAVLPTPAASAPAAPPSAPARPASSTLPVPVVEFRARAASWIEVTDGSGTPAIRRTLVAGETVVVGGRLPLSVVVGRADVTQVQVRGQAYDLAPVSRDNVARFQVK